MIEATTDELLAYLADVIERAERFGAAVLPPYDAETVGWERDAGALVMDLVVHPPVGRRSRLVEMVLRERWRTAGSDRWLLAEYSYELLDHELDYRRALHRHDVDRFVRAYGVATHEHCEATMARPSRAHYSPEECRGAVDGLDRLYEAWIAREKPACGRLRCLE